MTGYLLLALLALPAAVVSSAVSTPAGLLPLCFPRRWRWAYRSHLRQRRFRPRGRGRQRSARISVRLRAMVERADRHRCVACGARRAPGTALQVDHMIPWIMGGLTCLWNCALLCRPCNTVKSAYWRSPEGKVYYRRGHRAPPRAALILAAERRARHNPLRWLRAYGLLPGW